MSKIINAIIFLATAILVVRCFRKDGKWQLERGLNALRFFTILSNILCALAALAVFISPSPAALTLKYMGTVAVTVTMLTVLLFLGPTQGGYKALLSGGDLYLHLLGPLLAIASYCFFEKRDLSFSGALLGLLPVVAYGILYLYKVVCAPQEKRWEDFYGFNRGGKWPIAMTAMFLGTFIVCVAIWLI